LLDKKRIKVKNTNHFRRSNFDNYSFMFLAMRITIIYFILVFVPFILFGQTKKIETMNSTIPIGKIYVVKGHVFSPQNPDEIPLANELKFCDDYEHLYFIDGLQIKNSDFINLKIKKKDINYSQSKFSYLHNQHSPVECIKAVNLYIDILIPIYINNVELNAKELEKWNNNFFIVNLISIKYKKSLFGKNRIEIYYK
jgi:hypothetical protein